MTIMNTQTASRLDDSLPESGALVPISPLASSPSAWKRSCTTVSAHSSRHSSPSDFIANVQHKKKQPQSYAATPRQESGAPLAQVLNNGPPTPHASQDVPATLIPLTAPFNGRLRDLLLNSPEVVQDDRNGRDRHIQSPLAACENSLIKLPKLPQLPKKAARRPRIPPLLQGLHQPPPLPPKGKLFPPIIGESTRFQKNVKVKVSSETGTTLRNNIQEDSISPSRASRTDLFQTPQEGRDTKTKDSVILDTSHDQIGQAAVDGETLCDYNAGRRSRKRRLWSEQETKDLLIGVSKFGIGNWKKILHFPDFAFHGRTAVDLKDRFRVCCPGEGLRLRKSRAKKTLPEESSTTSIDPTASLEIGNTHNGENSCEKLPMGQELVDKEHEHRRVAASTKLAMLGIDSPFVRNKRRKRREFSVQDDTNLLKGFERYGATWHSMRDDTELGFDTRHPTDLRDRFRIRYPEMYARAGYKLKPKDEQRLRDRTKQVERRASSMLLQSPSSDAKFTADGNLQPPDMVTMGGSFPTALLDTASLISTTPTSKPSIFEPLSMPLDESTYLFSEADDDDDDDDQSQIVLNRSILQWADAKSSSAFANSSMPAYPQRSSHVVGGDVLFNAFAANDGSMHANLLTTNRFHATAVGSSPPAMTMSQYPFLPGFASYKPVVHNNAERSVGHGSVNAAVYSESGSVNAPSTSLFFKSPSNVLF